MRYGAKKKAEYNATIEAKASRKASYEKNKRAHQLRVAARKRKYRPELTEERWQAVLIKFGRVCLSCGAHDDLTKDHVTPVSLGGRDTEDNVQPLCRSCNSKKGTKTTDFRKRLTQP